MQFNINTAKDREKGYYSHSRDHTSTMVNYGIVQQIDSINSWKGKVVKRIGQPPLNTSRRWPRPNEQRDTGRHMGSLREVYTLGFKSLKLSNQHARFKNLAKARGVNVLDDDKWYPVAIKGVVATSKLIADAATRK